MKSLERAAFFEQAERISARYDKTEDALFLGMLGQEYAIRREGVYLHGQHAPDVHATVVLDYLFSSGTTLNVMPWRTIGDIAGRSVLDFRRKVELPISSYAFEIMSRVNTLLPMLDAKPVASLIGSDMAIVVQALPKVYLRMELSQETQDFPAEAWMLFSNNAHEYLPAQSLQLLSEAFKDRLLSLIRIY